MSDDATPETATAKPKGKGKKLILMLVVLLVLGGAGAAGGLYAAGAFTHEDTGPKEDPNKPVLVLKGESAEEVAVAHGAVLASEKGGEGGGHGGGGAPASAAPEGAHAHPIPAKGIDLPTPANPNQYQTTYFQLPTPFTSNMTDSDSFAQISIAVSTYYDARVIQSLTTHELALRSAILMMLAQQQELALSTPEGKEALQRKLKDVINQTLKQKTGYGGIDNVYFTNFVIQ